MKAELTKLAITNIFYAMSIAMSGTLSGSMFISAFGTDWNFTGSNFSDGVAGVAVGYAFYFCIRESLKVSEKVRELTRRK